MLLASFDKSVNAIIVENMKHEKRFEIDIPYSKTSMVYGMPKTIHLFDLRVGGIGYRYSEHSYGFDIDSIHYNGMNVLELLKTLFGLDEIDSIQAAVADHMSFLFDTDEKKAQDITEFDLNTKEAA